MTTITFDTSENLAETLYRFAQTKQKSLNETLNDIVQAYFEKSTPASKFSALKNCQNDPLFLSDLQAIHDDFDTIDGETW
jgi:hypothetical protein